MTTLKKADMNVHISKHIKDNYAVHAPCTGNKPLRFISRVEAYDCYHRMCRRYGADFCKIERIK